MDKCTKWHHSFFHLNMGKNRSVTTINKSGSLPYVDYHYSMHECAICKKKWIEDLSVEEREWEKVRDNFLNTSKDG